MAKVTLMLLVLCAFVGALPRVRRELVEQSVEGSAEAVGDEPVGAEAEGIKGYLFVAKLVVFYIVAFNVAGLLNEKWDAIVGFKDHSAPHVFRSFITIITLSVCLEFLDNFLSALDAGGMAEIPDQLDLQVRGLSYFATYALCISITMMYMNKDGVAESTKYVTRLFAFSMLVLTIVLTAIRGTDDTQQMIFGVVIIIQLPYWCARETKLLAAKVVLFSVLLFLAYACPNDNPQKDTMQDMTMAVKALLLEPLLETVFEKLEDLETDANESDEDKELQAKA